MHQVDMATLGIIGTVIVTFAGGYAVLARYIWNQRERAAEKAMEALKVDCVKQIDEVKLTSTKQIDEVKMHHNNAVVELQKTAERLRLDELATMELKGKLALLEQRHDGLDDDIKEIKREQVPRAEWERAMNAMSTQLRDIQQMLQRPGSYSTSPRSGSSPQNPVAPR